MEMIIAVTGGRDFVDDGRMGLAFKAIDGSAERIILVHGGASGADLTAGSLASHLGWQVEAYPVDTSIDGPWPGAGPRRNERMLDSANPELVLAFPGPKSRGTWHCIQAAWKRGIRVEIPGKEY